MIAGDRLTFRPVPGKVERQLAVMANGQEVD
jgi:hypothetical protein